MRRIKVLLAVAAGQVAIVVTDPAGSDHTAVTVPWAIPVGAAICGLMTAALVAATWKLSPKRD